MLSVEHIMELQTIGDYTMIVQAGSLKFLHRILTDISFEQFISQLDTLTALVATDFFRFLPRGVFWMSAACNNIISRYKGHFTVQVKLGATVYGDHHSQQIQSQWHLYI